MAKSSNRRINLYINGKEVEDSVKNIRSVMSKLNNDLNQMTIGSKEYINTTKKIKELKGYLNEHSESIKVAANAWDAWQKKFLILGAGLGGFTQIFTALNKIIGIIRQPAQDFAALDDVYSNVMKTTQLTREQVEELNDSFKKLDTRTSREQLNNLAYIAGKLGISSKELVQQFVEASNVINIAMGDVLGDDATLAIGKMVDVYKRSSDIIKDLDLKGQMLSLGSAVNELGKTSTANEKYMVNFSGRLGGIAVQAGLSADQILGFASALDQDMQRVEMSATAFQKLIQKIIAKPGEFAKVAGMEIKEFTQLISEDMNEALKRTLKGFQGAGGFDKLMPVFKELGLDAARASAAISSMANSLHKVETAQNIAKTAMIEATSMTKEYDIKNNNLQASLEKARKKIYDLRIELGEKLYPLLINFTRTSTMGLKALSNTVSVVNENKGAVLSIIAPLALYLLRLNYLYLKKAAFNTYLKISTGLINLQRSATLRIAAAKYTLAGNTEMATKAMKLYHAASATVPWVLLATIVAAVGVGIYKLATNLSGAEKAMKEFNKESAKTEAQAKYLFDALKKTETGSKEYHAILTKLKELYPEIIAYHLDKEGALRNIEAAYKDVITQIRTSIAEQMKEKAVTSEIEDTLKRQKKLYSNLRNELVKQAGETVADTIIDRVVEGIKNGNLKETLEKLINEFDKIDWFRMSKIPFTDKNSLFNANLLGLITKIETIGKESSQALKDIDSAFDPLIKKPIALLTEIEKLELQLKELLAAFEGAETKNEKEAIREDIKLLKEKIALIKEAKEGEEENTLDYTLDGDGKGKDKWAELLEKVRKYQERRRIALLEGFEKERAQIVSQYDELIKEAETFGIKGKKLAKKLEEEKGEDVIAAAKKYLEKYAEITQKFQDEVLKLAEKTSIKKEESALLKEWLGTDREWREKINSIAVHIEELEEMFEKSTSQAEMHAVVDQLDALYDARLEAVKEHEAAKANVIKKYLHDNNKLVKEREEELTGYYKTERQKRTDEINRQYNERITAEKKTLEGLRSLQKEGNKTISEQNIKELEELIDKLEALRDKEIKVLIRTEGNWLEQLLDIDWANFGDNWEKNLEIMANAAQTMADSMFDLWDNINKISINNMQKELNAFKKAKDEELEVVRKISDEKKNKLSDQLDKGIISQEYYNAQLTKLEQERADKEAEIAAEKEAKELALKKEQFRIDKQAAITKAIISGIVAIMQCYAQSGPIIGSILAALQIGLTAAQVAAISSQPEPYYKGGYIDDEKIIRAGERGREWVASNSLLQDPNTAPFIEALEKYQRGNKNPWNNLVFTTPNASDVSQAASSISHNFAHNKYYSNTNNYVTANNKTSNDKMTDMLDKLYNFLENNKVIGAVLSRKLQEEVNEQETYLRKLATL